MTLLHLRARLPARRRRRLAGALVGAVAVAAVSVWGPQALPGVDRAHGSPGTVAPVTIRSMAFEPRVIYIEAGETVRWINADVANHQVSTGVVDGRRPRPDGRVSSPLLLRGDEAAATFREAGVYPYYCAVHPFMQGSVVVTRAEAP